MVYTVTKIFGVDCVKTRVFRYLEDAKNDIAEAVRMFKYDDEDVTIIENHDSEISYIIHDSDDPSEYIEFVLRRCEIK